MAPHSSTLAWKIPWTEEPGRLQSMGSQRVGQDWATSLSLFTFMHWRRKWQPTPVFLPGESQGLGSLVGCLSMGLHRVGHDWSDLGAAAAQYRLQFYGFWQMHSHMFSYAVPYRKAGDPSLIPGSKYSPGEWIGYPLQYSWASLVIPMVMNLPAMQETWVWSLGWEDSPEGGHGNSIQYSCLVNSHGQMHLAG